jgi:2-iminobutanoate/2-iminopropanoate deaminase
MDIVEVKPEKVWPTEGNYAHATSMPATARQVFISGQIPTLEDGSIPDGFEAQCEAVWENISRILEATDMSFTNLVKVNTFLTSRDFADLNGEIRRKYLGNHRPALTVIAATTLDPRWLLEIEAIAIG